MVFQDNSEDVVVFFDFENIVYSLRNTLGENPNFELLMEKCQEYGRIVLARAYADWSRHNTVISALQSSGFDPIYVPTYFYESKERKARKNAVDIHIAIEAVEVMFTQPHINTFILLTGDKDFIPLANALRRNGKTVIAVGVQGTTSPYMRQATDDFIYYQQLWEEQVGKKRKPLQKDIYKVLVEAVVNLKNENQKTVFPQVKHTMTEMLGSFDEKDYTDSKGVNFNRFKDFILEAQRLGHVQLVTTGSVNEVLLPGDIHEPENPAKEVEIDEIDPNQPPVVNDTESAFDLLVWAVNHASKEGKSLRASSIKTIMRSADKDFDEKKFTDEKGEHFIKFSDFTYAASRRGLVRIRGYGIQMEVYPNGDQEAGGSSSTVFRREAVSKEEQTILTNQAFHEEPLPPLAGETALEEEQPDGTGEALGGEDQQISENKKRQVETPIPDEIVQPSGDSNIASKALPDKDPSSQYKPNVYVNDYRLRVLVVDALRNGNYPAPAHTIGIHCLDISEKRNIAMPNRRLNQLLTSAREKGLLREASNNDAEIKEFTFVENSERIRSFLEDET